ncbi:MAG: amidohydrolase family protein [Gemmatimonadales bacterium]
MHRRALHPLTAIGRWAILPSFGLLALLAGCGTSPRYDLLIRGGTVVDGTGAPGRVADVAVRGDSIVAVGAVEGDAAETVDATGLVVAPGFFDLHSHSEYDRLEDGHGPSFSLPGITTEIFGEDGSMGPLGGKRAADGLRPDIAMPWTSLGGFLDTLEARGTAANFGSYLGTGSVRAYVMGYDDRPPTPAELDSMRAVVREAMAEGALGVSSGLSYVPNIFASTEELVALAREAAAAGGIYASHIRTINGKDPEAVREAVTIADSAGIAVHLFHLNSVASTSAPAFLAIIDSARARGVRITGDSYTYTWGITGLPDYLPSWVLAGGTDSMLARLANRKLRPRIAWGFRHEEPFYALVGWDKVRLGVADSALNGKLVSEVAAERGVSGDDAYMDAVLAAKGVGLIIDWNNEEATLRQVLAAPYVAGGTDGMAVNLSRPQQWPLLHPRLLGTFPRWLGRYAREDGLMSLEEAVRRFTSLPASITGLSDRGRVAEGLKADLVVFDPEGIIDRATFEDPNHYAEGMRWVFVNGVAVVADGAATDALPGRALRGPGYRARR